MGWVMEQAGIDEGLALVAADQRAAMRGEDVLDPIGAGAVGERQGHRVVAGEGQDWGLEALAALATGVEEDRESWQMAHDRFGDGVEVMAGGMGHLFG